MKPGALVVAVIALIVLGFDQLAKFLVLQLIGMGSAWYPLPVFEWLRVVPSINTGTACGYFPQLSILFTIAPFVILAVVIWFYRSQKIPSWLLSIGVGLIIGGAFGNLVDRLRFGYVVDFVQVGTFPIFNVADAAVSTAVVLLLLWSLREDTRSKEAAAQGETLPANSSWKLGVIFIGVLGVIAVLTYFVCVYLPGSFLR